MATVLSPDEVTDLTLLLIAETRPYRASVMNIFDSLPLQQRAIVATTLLREMPATQSFEILRRFTEIEHLTNQYERALNAGN